MPRRPSPRLPLERHLAWTALALIAVLALFETTNLDLWVQDRLFDFTTGTWLIDAHDPFWRALCYNGPKVLIIAGGVLVLALLAGPARWRQIFGGVDRKALAVVLLTLATVPGLISVLKATTNVFCPYEIRRYGGTVPYVRVFERYPPGDRPESCGRCFPAGHASGGFALLALAFLARTRRGQLAGLGVGLAAGGVMGVYQMMKGAHYLSHTLLTALIAWLFACLWYRLLFRTWKRRADLPPAEDGVSHSHHG